MRDLKVVGGTLPCDLKKIENRKIKIAYQKGILLDMQREEEVNSNNIPKDRSVERFQIANRLAKKLEKKKANMRVRRFLDGH